MAALRNRKLELLAQELANGKTSEEASRSAGYADGSSFKANARKRSQDKKVKARVVELRAPGIAKAEEHVAITTEYILAKCGQIMQPKLSKDKIKAADQIAAGRLAAQIIGALAPERHEHSGPGGQPLKVMHALTDEQLLAIAATGGPRALEAPEGP